MGGIVSKRREYPIINNYNTNYEKIKEISTILNNRKFRFNNYNKNLCKDYVVDLYRIIDHFPNYQGLFLINKIDVFYYTIRYNYVEHPHLLFDANKLIEEYLSTKNNSGLYFPWSDAENTAYKIFLYLLIQKMHIKFCITNRSINAIMMYVICNNDYKNGSRLLEMYPDIIDFDDKSDNGETHYTHAQRKNAFNFINLFHAFELRHENTNRTV
jgi:hypothetical protein